MRPFMKRSSRSYIAGLVAALGIALPLASHAAPSCSNWPAWDSFRSHFVNDGGRVIDPATPPGYTTSEGQSYGLFFALVANDQESFARILRWTEDNLAQGDLTAHLPAWQWGKRDDGNWGVVDTTAASDADLWIVYALSEAGRLWKVQKYTATAQLLAERVLREETVDVTGLGRVLLPGTQGFQPQPDMVRLNPSYTPIELMRHFAALYPQPEWKALASTSIDVMVRSSPRGYAPDWVLYKTGSGFLPDASTKAAGSYNAIRVYLWNGMLADDEPVRSILLKTFAPAAQYVVKNGTPPLETNTREGSASGTGSAGFSAAMLPFLAASHLPDAAKQQRLRVEARSPLERADNYYDQALTLFGLGWTEGYYRFARDGSLIARWTCANN
jgi:endo-1,4-beta-D-glucanase Y